MSEDIYDRHTRELREARHAGIFAGVVGCILFFGGLQFLQSLIRAFWGY